MQLVLLFLLLLLFLFLLLLLFMRNGQMQQKPSWQHKNSKQGKQLEKLELKLFFVTAILAVIKLKLEKGDSLAQM